MYHTQRSKQDRLHLPLRSAALRDKGRRRIRPGGSMQAGTSSSVLCSELTQTADRRTVGPVHRGSFCSQLPRVQLTWGKGRELKLCLHLSA